MIIEFSKRKENNLIGKSLTTPFWKHAKSFLLEHKQSSDAIEICNNKIGR